MKPSATLVALLVTLTLAVAFIGLSSGSLPPVVASHFTAGGAADGFMPRDGYLSLMLGMTVGVPLLVTALSWTVRLFPVRLINLPDREYWLAPERAAQTVSYLANRGAILGTLVAAFMGFVHWLVLLANQRQPPHFPESLFLPGSLLFLALLAVWIGTVFAHFRRRA
jgi:hypothetical protein